MEKELSQENKSSGFEAANKSIRVNKMPVNFSQGKSRIENGKPGSTAMDNARKSHKAFFTVFHSSPVAKALLDPATNKYVEVNRAFLKLFECRKNTVLGKSPDELGFWADRSERTRVLKTYRKNKIGSFNIDILSSKGKIKNVIISTEEIILFNKEYLLGYLIDNTEIHEYEKKLKESEHKYRLLLNNNQNAIYEYDFRNTRYSYVSPSIEAILGIPPEVFIKNRNNIITPLLDKESRKKIREHYKLLKFSTGRKKKYFRIEYPFTLKNQDEIWVADDQAVIYGKSGKAECVIGNISDITVRKTNEILLKKSEEQYKVLFFSNPLPMWIYDCESLKILAVNESAVKQYGYSEEEFLKMHLTDIRPKKEIAKFLRYQEQIKGVKEQKRSSRAGIWKHIKKSGEIIDVEITRTPLSFEGHEAVLVLANNVTERTRSEAALIKRNSEISELYRAGKELSKTLERGKIYNSIYKIIRKIMPCDSMVISGYDAASKMITCQAAWIGRKRLDVSAFPSIPADFSGKGLQSRVIKSGKPELLLNFQKTVSQSKVKFYYKPDGTVHNRPNNKNLSEQSAIIAPLKLRNKVVGVLQVKSLKENAYTENDVKLVESLAAQVAVSTSNADLYQQAQNEIKVRKEAESKLLKTSKEISNIYEISKDLSGALTVDEINRKIFRIINSSFPECDIGISVLDEKEENIVLKGLFTNGKEVNTAEMPAIKFDKSGKGLQSSVIVSKKTRIIDDYKEYIKKSGAHFYVKDDGTVVHEKEDSFELAESALIIPLIYEKKVIGTLQLLNYSKNGFSENALKVLESLASHIAVSIENAQLHSKIQNELHEKQMAEKALQIKTEELQILYDAQQVLSGSLDIESIYDNTYKIIISKIPCDSMIISSYNDASKIIKILSVWADGVKPNINIFPEIPLAPENHGIQSEVIRTGNSLLIDNYKEFFEKTVTSYRYTDNEIFEEIETLYNSAIVIPMKHEGKIIGVIQLLSYKQDAYNLSNLKLLESLASPISAATFNASLYRQAQIEIAEKQKAREELALRNKEITLLYSAGRELLSTLNLEEIYETLYRKVIDVIDCDSMIISEYIGNTDQIICKAAWVENTKHDPKNFPPLKIGKNYNGTQAEAIVTGKSLIVNNFSEVIKNRDDKYYLDENGEVINYRRSKEKIDPRDPVVNSAMYIPMKIGKNVIGVISVFSFKKNAYSEYDLKILESITVHLSVAAANAELYNRAQKEISERIKKEEELKQIRKNLENAQRIAHLGSWMYDLKGNKLYNSSELYRILGLKNEPEFFDFEEGMNHIHPEDKENTISKIQEAIKNRSSYENEDRIITPDGEVRNVKIVGEPIYDDKGKILGLQGTLQDITDIKRINNELVKSLNEKELILKEIHHRVKNNLQVVSSLLRLQSDSITDKAAIGYLKMSEQRVKSMALIHQQLYRTKDLSRIDFREYLEDLCHYLFFAYDISFSRVALKVEVEDIYFGIDTALPCGLIVNELVTNSIKHAFPEYTVGTLTVRLTHEITGKYILVIQDDGKGADVINFENNTTLGMELVKTLTEQLEGEISVESINGTKITITFFDQNID